jgi:hypothetical protein
MDNDSDETRVCTMCFIRRPVSKFNKKGNGIRAHCKACQSVYWERFCRKQSPEIDHQMTSSGMSRCGRCKFLKTASHFSAGQRYCLACQADLMEARSGEIDPSAKLRVDDLYIMTNSKLTDIVKIGRSKHPTTRAAQLAEGHPFQINVDFRYEGYGFLECLIHRKLLNHRIDDGIGREWFDMSPSQADAIVTGVIAEFELSDSRVRLPCDADIYH